MGRLYFRLSLMREPPALRSSEAGFHGIALEAHIVELYANAVSTFLAGMRKPYFVDPVLYKFSVPLFGELSEKRWVEILSETYGLEALLATRPDGLEGKDLIGLTNTTDAVRAMVEYQRNRIPTVMKSVAPLASLFDEQPVSITGPEFIVSPYVIVNNKTALAANLTMAGAAASMRRPSERVYGSIAIARDYLSNPRALQEISLAYSGLPLDGYVIWVADFKDWEEDPLLLRAFADFVQGLSSGPAGREVINVFGGYFSAILAAKGLLGGSVQGVGIAEFRDPLLSGGGFVKRYYLPVSHQMVSVDFADDLRSADPSLFGCACSICAMGSSPTTMSVQDLAAHFVRCRTKEFEEAAGTPIADIVHNLDVDASRLGTIRAPGVAPLANRHAQRLGVWRDTLRDLNRAGMLG